MRLGKRYILDSDPIRRRGKRPRREILDKDQPGRHVVVEVDNDDATAVLEALWRVYDDGREDLGNELAADRTARQQNTEQEWL
jgi:hypothetical protein